MLLVLVINCGFELVHHSLYRIYFLNKLEPLLVIVGIPTYTYAQVKV